MVGLGAIIMPVQPTMAVGGGQLVSVWELAIGPRSTVGRRLQTAILGPSKESGSGEPIPQAYLRTDTN